VSWIRPRDHNIFANAGSLVLCGLLAGVVVAAALFPGVAMSGLLAKESLERFDELPDELTVLDGPQISYLYASDGKTLLASMYDENRRNITLDDVPQVMIDALLSAEDRNFYDHIGVDMRGIARAFIANTGAGDITQGASTVTQQFVRLALTYFAEHPQEIVEATEDTHARKLREARLAMAVEQQMSKDEILGRYLNLAYFGEGAYGIFAASQVYFGKRPMDLELHEAAMLAAIVKAPSQFSPASEDQLDIATERRDWVLDQMVDTGVITPEEAQDAKAIELEARAERQPNECVNTAENHWGFFCDFFYRWWVEQEVFGATTWERERRLKGGGYHIVTTLDVDVQESMKEYVDSQIKTSAKEPHALMLAAIEPGTGRVRAMATNRNFSLDESGNGEHTDPVKRRQGLTGTYPNTTNPLITGGGDIFGYQSGSTAKLYTMIAGLEEGMPLDHNIRSPERVTTRFVVEAGNRSSCGNFWCPRNFPRQAPGTYNMWTGFGSSINTYFAQLIQQAGADNAVDVAKRLGMKFREPVDAQLADNAAGWGAFTLGVAHTTPLDLASAYSTVSAEGIHCEPLPVEEIRTIDGATLDIANPDCDRAIDKDIARAAIDAGRCVVGAPSKFGECRGGTARAVPDTFEPTTSLIRQPIWGKTGTADGSRTYSFVLSTKQLTVAGQLADPDWADTDQTMDGAKVRLAVMRTMSDAMDGVESEDWPRPGREKLVYGERVNIPGVECLPVSEAEAAVSAAGFDVSVDDDAVDSECEKGLTAGTDPSGSTSRGSTVVILVSNGSDHEPEPEPTPEPGPPETGPPGNGRGGDDDDGDGGGDGGGSDGRGDDG
jgi:membrane peptidoglycan carboxypeptidase